MKKNKDCKNVNSLIISCVNEINLNKDYNELFLKDSKKQL